MGVVRLACVPCLCSDSELLVTFCLVYALYIYWCGIIFSRIIICPRVREWLVNACKVIFSKYLWYCVGKSFSMLGRKVVGCAGG